MKLLAEISDYTLGLGEAEQLEGQYRLRKSARAILIDKEGNMATQHVRRYDFHKLPGGGVDVGEEIERALVREVQEEVGCECVIEELVGVVIEYRSEHQLLHVSYCYVAQVVGELGTPTLEESEVAEGQETLWLPPREVLRKMEHDVPKKYSGHFILAREKAFLQEYLDTV